MLFSVAGLRRCAAAAFACLAFSSIVEAREKTIFTSSVSYCEAPDLILIQQFDLVYFAANESVFFNISAASVEDNVNVTANLLLNVYGMDSVNVTINLCDLLDGALCPLPTYNFIGSQTLPLSSLGVTNLDHRIPGVVYWIPDVEAFAQLTLTRVDTGEVKACIQSTLSNGWSTRQLAVEWVTGGLAIFALLSALLATALFVPSLAPQRFVDLMLLFQTIAASALLDLNYPVLYRAFATNFSWALGLFGSEHGSAIQDAIDDMRNATGGDMSDTNGGDGVDLVNRKLSPYNVGAVMSAQTLEAVRNLQRKIEANTLLRNVGNGTSDALRRLTRRDSAIQEGTQTVTDQNVLNAGIPVYVNSLGISTTNAFMTVFLILLMLTAIALTVLGLVGLAALVISKRKRRSEEDQGRFGDWWLTLVAFSKSWALRLILVVFIPVMIFSLHQWTLNDSWLATLFAVLTFLVILFFVLYPSFLTIRLARRSRPEALYEESQHRASFGLFYEAYRPARWWFFTLPLSVLFAKAIITAFGYGSGIVQLIFILIIELLLFISLLVFRPHTTRGADVLASTLSIARILITILSFVFVESFGIGAIPRVGVGIAAAVVASLSVILMFFNIVINFALWAVWRKHVARRFGTRLGSSLRLGNWGRISPGRSESGSGKGSIVEKDPQDVSETVSRIRGGASSSVAHNDRPENPTPDQSPPIDPSLNLLHPATSPSTPTSSASPASEKAFHRNSDYRVSYASSQMPSTGTTFSTFGAASTSTESTFGTELPRRPDYEGLGLDRLDLELGAASASPSDGSSSSRPTTVSSRGLSVRGSRLDSWTPSAALPRMPEGAEGESEREGAVGEERRTSQPTRQ